MNVEPQAIYDEPRYPTKLDELTVEAKREKELCKKCAFVTRCINDCACLNWQTTGLPDGMSPVMCRHEKILIPITDRVGGILFKRMDGRFLAKHYCEAYPLLSGLEDSIA